MLCPVLTKKVLFERSNQIISCLCAYFAPLPAEASAQAGLRLRGLEFFTAK
jgi:hypothetical protein